MWSPQKALECYQQALAADPNYALAYVGLADLYKRMGFFYSAPVAEYYVRAKAAVMKALELDSTLSEAHATLGHFKTQYEWDWQGAERELKRAIDLGPILFT